MPEIPGDQNIAKLFGVQGLEALIRVTLKYINLLRVEQGSPVLTYEEFRAEIEAKDVDIDNGAP